MLGTTSLTIGGKDVIFHVVKNDFPLKYDGMLERGFFKDQQAAISYYSKALMIAGDVMNLIPFLDSENCEWMDRKRLKQGRQITRDSVTENSEDCIY